MKKNTLPNGMPTSSDPADTSGTAQTLVTLCAGLLPVWSRQLATARSQSEVAVSEMMQAFSSITPHVQLAESHSQRIAQAMHQGDPCLAGLSRACEQALAPLVNHAQLPAGGADAIAAVLALVRQAVATVEQFSQPLTQETQHVAAQVERMYMGFQYQDRISQQIALLETDMARLQEVVDGRCAEPPDLPAWLARLEAQYAMTDQRQSHGGTDQASAAADQETTFF